MKPIVYIPVFPGTNCHHEALYAFSRVGADARLILLNQLIKGTVRLDECDILNFAGGFSFGDDIAAGRIAAWIMQKSFPDQLENIKKKKILVLGQCNGFQIETEAGFLPGVLDFNLSARFEHWAKTRVIIHHDPKMNCPWTRGLDGLEIIMPSANCQGFPILDTNGHYAVMATYGNYKGQAEYPISPNGSAIAGICNEHIAGLMPHPERAGKAGLAIFEAGVNAVKG